MIIKIENLMAFFMMMFKTKENKKNLIAMKNIILSKIYK